MIENLPLARLVLKQAEEFPETVSMRAWGFLTPCGTIACLAGHTMLLSGYEYDHLGVQFLSPEDAVVEHEANEALMLLGATGEHEEQLKTLFYSDSLMASEAASQLRDIIEAAETATERKPPEEASQPT